MASSELGCRLLAQGHEDGIKLGIGGAARTGLYLLFLFLVELIVLDNLERFRLFHEGTAFVGDPKQPVVLDIALYISRQDGLAEYRVEMTGVGTLARPEHFEFVVAVVAYFSVGVAA